MQIVIAYCYNKYLSIYNVCPIKNLFFLNFVFLICRLAEHGSFTILVPSPHDTPSMYYGGSDINFKVSMLRGRDILKTIFDKQVFYETHFMIQYSITH